MRRVPGAGARPDRRVELGGDELVECADTGAVSRAGGELLAGGRIAGVEQDPVRRLPRSRRPPWLAPGPLGPGNDAAEVGNADARGAGSVAGAIQRARLLGILRAAGR